MHTFLALPENVSFVYQLSNRKQFWSHAHPTYSPTSLLMIHCSRRNNTTLLEANNNYNIIHFLLLLLLLLLLLPLLLLLQNYAQVHNINKPCYMCTVSHLQCHSLRHHYLYQLLITCNCCWHVSDHGNCLNITHKQYISNESFTACSF